MFAATRLLSILCRLPAATPDADILRAYTAGQDEESFRQLVGHHGPMVQRLCRQRLGDIHAAEDAFPATFLILARKAAGLRRPDVLTPWLYAVARCVDLDEQAAIARTRQERRYGRGL